MPACKQGRWWRIQNHVNSTQWANWMPGKPATSVSFGSNWRSETYAGLQTVTLFHKVVEMGSMQISLIQLNSPSNHTKEQHSALPLGLRVSEHSDRGPCSKFRLRPTLQTPPRKLCVGTSSRNPSSSVRPLQIVTAPNRTLHVCWKLPCKTTTWEWTNLFWKAIGPFKVLRFQFRLATIKLFSKFFTATELFPRCRISCLLNYAVPKNKLKK